MGLGLPWRFARDEPVLSLDDISISGVMEWGIDLGFYSLKLTPRRVLYYIAPLVTDKG
jgi:hypothetical protein